MQLHCHLHHSISHQDGSKCWVSTHNLCDVRNQVCGQAVVREPLAKLVPWRRDGVARKWKTLSLLVLRAFAHFCGSWHTYWQVCMHMVCSFAFIRVFPSVLECTRGYERHATCNSVQECSFIPHTVCLNEVKKFLTQNEGANCEQCRPFNSGLGGEQAPFLHIPSLFVPLFFFHLPHGLVSSWLLLLPAGLRSASRKQEGLRSRDL